MNPTDMQPITSHRDSLHRADAIRDNLPTSKVDLRYDLILPDWLREIAEVLHEGATTHGDRSWQAIPLDEHLNRIMAHIQWYREGNHDERHLINAACRIMFAYWVDKYPTWQAIKLQDYLKEQERQHGVEETTIHRPQPDSGSPKMEVVNGYVMCTVCRQPMFVAKQQIVCLTETCSEYVAMPNNQVARLATASDIFR